VGLLKFLIGLPPRLAVAYLRRKGYVIGWDWEETLAEAHDRAFTVAKVTKLDILQDIRDAAEKALAEGQSERTFRQNLEPTLKQKGWWGTQETEEGETVQLGSPRRLRTIYRTNMQSAMMKGRAKDFLQDVEDRPYWQYVAVLDERTRPMHRRLDGRVFRWDDPFWRSFYPPLGFNCRCRVRALRARDVEKRGLTVESSEGLLSEGRSLLSVRSGIQVPTAILRDFEGDIRPDPGWSYDRVFGDGWQPDLGRYADDLRSQFEADRDS
jgi:SPP1 gp7 family putative phage head morphogenesis protein